MSKNYQNKKGLSLLEALMAIFIFSIGIAGFTLLFSQTWKTNSFAYKKGQASLAASQGVNTTVNYIRKARQGDDGAFPIKTAIADDLVIFSDYDKDGTTERLHFYKNNNQFLMGFRKPSAGLPKSYAEGDEEVITIANNVTNAANEPIFYYYNRNYPGANTNNPMAIPISVWDVRLIEIRLKIGDASSGMEVRSFVELRNLNDYSRLTS